MLSSFIGDMIVTHYGKIVELLRGKVTGYNISVNEIISLSIYKQKQFNYNNLLKDTIYNNIKNNLIPRK